MPGPVSQGSVFLTGLKSGVFAGSSDDLAAEPAVMPSVHDCHAGTAFPSGCLPVRV